MSGSLRLASGRVAAVVEGGSHLSVTSLTVDGVERLVRADELPPAYRVHGARAGITLLQPWANRLSVDPPALPAGAPRDPGGLAIHGLPADDGGWVLDDGGRTTLRPCWPVPHRVLVAFELLEDGVQVCTELHAETPVPIAFGWHPYLRPAGPRAGWVLGLPEHRALGLDDRGLPTGGHATRTAEAAPLGARRLDDAIDGLAEGAVLAAGELEVVLDEGYPAAQVFAPGDADVVALEPMTSAIDAWTRGEAPMARHHVARFSLRVGG